MDCCNNILHEKQRTHPRVDAHHAAAAVAPLRAVRPASAGRPPTGREVLSSGSGRLFQPFCMLMAPRHAAIPRWWIGGQAEGSPNSNTGMPIR